MKKTQLRIKHNSFGFWTYKMELDLGLNHRIKDDRMENYGEYIGFTSKQNCRTAKDCFTVADGSLCSRQQIVYEQGGCENFCFCNFAKYLQDI